MAVAAAAGISKLNTFISGLTEEKMCLFGHLGVPSIFSSSAQNCVKGAGMILD